MCGRARPRLYMDPTGAVMGRHPRGSGMIPKPPSGVIPPTFSHGPSSSLPKLRSRAHQNTILLLGKAILSGCQSHGGDRRVRFPMIRALHPLVSHEKWIQQARTGRHLHGRWYRTEKKDHAKN